MLNDTRPENGTDDQKILGKAGCEQGGECDQDFHCILQCLFFRYQGLSTYYDVKTEEYISFLCIWSIIMYLIYILDEVGA